MSSKTIITSLLTSLRSVGQPESANIPTPTTTHDTSLKHLPSSSQQKAKNVLLTLHFLFPHELLPALDLIDRRLITRLYTIAAAAAEQIEEPNQPVNEVYYVQSASSTSTSTDPTTLGLGTGRQSGRFRNALARPGTSYEVRLDSWNCSCPAFALGGLRLMMRSSGVGSPSRNTHDLGVEFGARTSEGKESELDWGWLFGGTTTRRDATTPVCKHILAVALARAAPALFGNGVSSRKVGREEMAGWAAGWGEH